MLRQKEEKEKKREESVYIFKVSVYISYHGVFFIFAFIWAFRLACKTLLDIKLREL